MWYPEQWCFKEDERSVFFATSEDLIAGEEIETGAAVLALAVPLEAVSFKDWFEEQSYFLAADEGIDACDQQPCLIDRRHGITVSFEGTPEGQETPVQGFLAATEHQNWGYLFLAVSTRDDWPQYSTFLEKMIDSVRFTARTPPSPVPTQDLVPDSWEPDDTLTEGSSIGPGETQSHNLHVEGDRDWVYFEARQGATYVIETSNLGDDIDTEIHLYDAQENELTHDDDRATEPWASRIWWTAAEDGTLYVMIREYSHVETGPRTSYQISLSLAEAFERDQYEPDDSPAQAARIGVGETQDHNLHAPGDRDWLYFEAQEGTTYVVETSNLAYDVDTEVYVYDERQDHLGYDDDGAGEALASRLEWTAAEDGTFYIMVRDFSDSVAGPGSAYDVSLSKT